ncbi:MAG: hypothetical protein HQL31_00945 [Planctomycetes bacterium]|nr:hypothetical protein [Planctomycetota bacterium]
MTGEESGQDLLRGDLMGSSIAFYASLFIVLIIAMQELPKEIQAKSHLLLLSKSISRSGYLMGKIVGIFMFGVLCLMVACASAYGALVMSCRHEVPFLANFFWPFMHYSLFIWIFSVITGISGAFLNEAFCALGGGFCLVGSYAIGLIPGIAEKTHDSGAVILLKSIYYIVPNIWYYRPGHYLNFDGFNFLTLVLYTLGYSGVLLPLALVKFKKISFN